jgi:hypothetical protein
MSLDIVGGLTLMRQRLSEDRYLAVLITTRPGRDEPQVAVVNATVIDHPVTAAPVLALVARQGAKLANLRLHPKLTLVARAGWEWVSAYGDAELSGPDDPHPSFDAESQRLLLRQIYEAAGGKHPDLDAYDKAMLDERRCAVLIHPTRIWSNPAGSEHLEPEDTP